MEWLTHEEITLRALEPQDVDVLMKWENNRDNWDISGTLAPFSRHTLERYIENAHLSIFEAGQYRFIIERKEDGRAIGTVDLFEFDAFHKRVGVGILIGDKSDRTKGFGKIALNLLLDYCLNYLDLHQVFCNIMVTNRVSIALFQEVGFVVSGTKKHWIRQGNRYEDEYFLQLIREE